MRKHEIFWGLLFISAAVLIILNQFGFFTGISMFDLVVTIILGGVIIKSITHLNFWGILFPLAIICILYADEWNIPDFSPWPVLLTALLLSIGFSILFKNHYFWGSHSHHNHNSFCNYTVNEKDGSIINCSTSFGECIKYVNSENFERANVNCSFGDIKVYFDNALIPSGKADLYLDISFGSAELYIPRSWRVVSKVHVFCGDIKDNGSINQDSPVVTIHGNVSFGDAKVIYV